MRSWPRCCGCRPGVRPAVSDRFSKVASPLPSPPPEGEGAQIREGPQSARVPKARGSPKGGEGAVPFGSRWGGARMTRSVITTGRLFSRNSNSGGQLDRWGAHLCVMNGEKDATEGTLNL